ncbi:MAG: hypothetical protein MRY74_04425 [Neomegalonema sp.]|nr:hypothetical protein [Neomegalonema sp.]
MMQDLSSELKADDRLSVADAKAIARAFTGTAGKSKKDALAKILKRQTTLLAGRAEWEDNDGRSAA